MIKGLKKPSRTFDSPLEIGLGVVSFACLAASNSIFEMSFAWEINGISVNSFCGFADDVSCALWLDSCVRAAGVVILPTCKLSK